MARRRRRTFENETVWDPAGDPDKRAHWTCSRCGEQVGPSQGIQDFNDPKNPKRRCSPCDADHVNNDPVEKMVLPPTVYSKPPTPKAAAPPAPKPPSTQAPKPPSTQVPEHSSTQAPESPKPGDLF